MDFVGYTIPFKRWLISHRGVGAFDFDKGKYILMTTQKGSVAQPPCMYIEEQKACVVAYEALKMVHLPAKRACE